MKITLFLALGLLAASGVYAADSSQTIINKRVTRETRFTTAPNFNVNRHDGRAWVEVDVTDYTFDDGATDRLRGQVNGLAYNESTKQVTLTIDGQQIVCANLEGPTWSRPLGDAVKPTGKCALRARMETRQEDNGYERYNSNYAIVELTLN